jgi:DNA-directed RNA polymerase subunit M/transcription elongation factor TFIIS
MTDDIIKTCDECGAAVYPDHLEKGTAGMVDEKLLCPVCYREYQRQNSKIEAEETIALVEEAEVPADTDDEKPEAKPKIKAFGDDSVFGQLVDHNEAKYQRPLTNTGRSAIRCRTFHTKLTDAALSYMDSVINEWIDKNPQIEVKFATSSIGMFEAKRLEPHLIITVFY